MRSSRKLINLRGKFLLFVSCSFCGSALAQEAAKYPSAPAEVVRQYCDFDFNTGRISSANFSKLPVLTTWKEEPGWDTIVKDFRILSSKQSKNFAVVTVRWLTLGQAEGDSVIESRKPEVSNMW